MNGAAGIGFGAGEFRRSLGHEERGLQGHSAGSPLEHLLLRRWVAVLLGRWLRVQGVARRYSGGSMKGHGVTFSSDYHILFQLQAVYVPFWGEARFRLHSGGLLNHAAWSPAPATMCQQSGQAGGPLGLRRAGPGWDLSRYWAG